MTTTFVKGNKNFSLKQFKPSRKQNLTRSSRKNVDPFPRNARRRVAGRPIRRRSRGRRRSSTKGRLLKFNRVRLARQLRREKKSGLRMRRPFVLWSGVKRLSRTLTYKRVRRNRYWRAQKSFRRYSRSRLVTIRRTLSVTSTPRAHSGGRAYSSTLLRVARRALIRASQPSLKVRLPNERPKKQPTVSKAERRHRFHRYLLKSNQRTPTIKVTAPRPTGLRLQLYRRKTSSRPLNIKRLRHVAFKRGRDRRKKYKRYWLKKSPSLRKKAKQLVFARQLIRKARSIRSVVTRVLQHRLLRHKYRAYRKARNRFDGIRYTRQLRVKRRAVRRARRYLRSTATILRGARTRTLHRRLLARKQRAISRQISQRVRLLLRNSATVGGKQLLRQHLLLRLEQRLWLRASRLINNRTSLPNQPATLQSTLRAHRTARKLRRTLMRRTSTLTSRRPTGRAPLTPAPATTAAHWLFRRQQRVRALRRHLPYFVAKLPVLKRYTTSRSALPPITACIGNNKLPSTSPRATLAAFRLAAARESLLTKNSTQTSRATTVSIRADRTRLLASRYYRTRPKLRLPNQKVRPAERKRQGLRLFARNTLKRPTTLSGRSKLLLPVPTRYTVTEWQPRSIFSIRDKSLSIPKQMHDYHPRVHFRGPRRYELGLILISRLRKSLKAGKQYRRSVKIRSKKRKSTSITTVKSVQQPNFEGLATAIQKAELTDSVALVKKFFKKLTFSSAAQQDAAKTLFLSRLRAAHLKLSSRKLLPTKTTHLSRRTATVERVALRSTHLTNSTLRARALLHLRSTQGMLNQERVLSAWSPQYGTAFRRWSSPRRYGLPLRSRKLSRLSRKLRRLVNSALARRNRPKRKYFDRSFGRIQYYHGSAASLGYARYRRVHRSRSKNNRWWKPLKHAVPFAHPYSRRSLNAKKGAQVNLRWALSARRGTTARTGRVSSRWVMPEEKPRRILSSTIKLPRRHYESYRDYSYRVRRERAKMPPTLQHWLPARMQGTAKIEAVAHENLILARTRRSIRKLGRTFPKSTVFASRHWEGLDSNTSTTSATTLFAVAVRHLSPSFWTQLQVSAGSQSKRVALQRKLFTRFCSWHSTAVAVPAVGGLNAAQQLIRAIRFVAATAGELLHGVANRTIHSDLDHTAFIRQITSKQQRSWKLLHFADGRSGSIYNRNNNALRRRWLHGAERYLKRNRAGRLPPRHRRGGDHRMINYGRNRRRFPASGRRKQSYDSMLHAFTKRVAPSRFRRVAVTRFQRIRSRIRRDVKLNRRVYALTCRHRVRRRVAQSLSRAAYLSPAWRELLSYRQNSPLTLPTTDYTAPATEVLSAAATSAVSASSPYTAQYGQPFTLSTKRRFASLPVNLLFKRAQSARRALHQGLALPLRAHRIGLLRAALRRRRMERPFVDLKKHTSRRRLAKEQLAPSWKRRRLARKREKYLRHGEWTSRHFWMRSAKTVSWTLHSLEERAPRRQDRALDTSLRSVSGEVLLLTFKTAKRRNWAKKGFQIKLSFPRVKARRSRKVARRRRRRPRRPSLGGWVKITHWAERSNYKRILSRGRRGKGVAARFTARKAYRSRIGLRPQRRLKASPLFTSRRGRFLKHPLLSNRALHSTTLARFSSLAHPRGVKRLQRRAAYRRSKFLRRRVNALRRQQHQPCNSDNALATARQLASRTLQPFTKNIVPRTPLVPLTFVRPTRRVIKTEAEKRQAVVWNIKSKEIRYKKTAQYTESLTHFIPALMSYMISRHTIHKKLTYSYIKGLINATYWNLRIYLNVDPFAGRLKLRDRNFKQLRFLTKAIARLAKEQVTEHANRMHLRWRFQPCRLQPAPSSDRFRLDWLRVFFPRKHALYQEDPEHYSRVTLSSRNIRRVPLTGYGISRARTYRATISVERRARHLLRLRLSRREPRLETVLQTTRRTPVTEVEQFVPVLVPDTEEVALEKGRLLAQKAAEEDADIFARSKKFVFVKTPRYPKLTSAEIAAAELDLLFDEHITARSSHDTQRISFFQRYYSTTTHRTLISTAKLIAAQGRLAAVEGAPSTTFSELSARARVKARLVARGRTDFVASTDFMVNAGSLDPRFLRYKSPRNRQYEVRKLSTPAAKRNTTFQFTALSYFHQKRNHLLPPRESKPLARLRRRHFYFNTPVSTRTLLSRTLTDIRTATPARRSPTGVYSRVTRAKQQARRLQLDNFPNREQLTFTPPAELAKRTLFRKEAHLFEALPLVKGQLRYHWHSHVGETAVVSGDRAALLYRTPAHRSTSHTYRADRVLAYRPIRPRRAAIVRSKSGKRAIRTLKRVQRRYRNALTGLRFAWGLTPLKGEVKAHRAISAASTLQHITGRTLICFRSTRATARFIKRIQQPGATGGLHFRNVAFRRIAHLSHFTRRCVIQQRINYQTPFDTYRPKLWHMLTHRWMKKHRILKEWLKEVNHWLRDPWLSLLVDPTRRGKRVPGEIRAREQQDGEVVTGSENAGFTEAEKAARLKAARQAIAGALTVVKKDIEHTKRHVDLAPRAKKAKLVRRLKRSRLVLRKPRPSMWLANLQCKRWVAEKAAWIAKPKAEKRAHLLERKKLSIERVKQGKPRLGPKAAPLKVPADHFIPRIIWKDIHRRVRRLTWRESDDAFTRRGFRNAFKFYPAERNRAPWLEALMYNRSLYSTNLREFRRHQFPHEQKKYKWLQRVRKAFFPGRTHVYIKGRRWPRLRVYNQRLHYSLFNLPNRSAARRHFKKLRGRSRTIGFVHVQEGLSNRLDNVLVHLNMAPTIFWARHVATRGLLRINGKIADRADYRLKAGDFIEPVWDKVIKYRHFFKNPLRRHEEKFRPHRWSPTGVSRNFQYHPTVRCYTFLGNPREEDLRQSSRLQPHLFRWFLLDSVAKKSVT